MSTNNFFGGSNVRQVTSIQLSLLLQLVQLMSCKKSIPYCFTHSKSSWLCSVTPHKSNVYINFGKSVNCIKLLWNNNKIQLLNSYKSISFRIKFYITRFFVYDLCETLFVVILVYFHYFSSFEKCFMLSVVFRHSLKL